MRPSKKLWLLVALAVCFILVQYQLVSYWLISRNSQNDATLVTLDEASMDILVRGALKRVQQDSHLGQKLLRQLVVHVSQELAAFGGCTTTQSAETHPPEIVQDKNIQIQPIYLVTPTYRRPEQIPELTRMAQTLMHVHELTWLVVEDAAIPTPQVSLLLQRSGITHIHLVAPMPEIYKKRRGVKPRGVSNRNRGLQWIRANATKGVVYFADDDNTYDIRLFEEIRTTNKVSMFPVGLCTKFGLSSPIVQNGAFHGFYDGWMGGRKFPVDMAGFAVSVLFLKQRPKAIMPYRPGYEEDGFLKSLAPFEPWEIELKAENCTKILVWHTQAKKNEPSAALPKEYLDTNLGILKQQIV